ncbi:MAG: hypothetical protein REI77_03650 [Luteibacter sp.]|nr:hypothetical protein [Luteibacter sp.]
MSSVTGIKIVKYRLRQRTAGVAESDADFRFLLSYLGVTCSGTSYADFASAHAELLVLDREFKLNEEKGQSNGSSESSSLRRHLKPARFPHPRKISEVLKELGIRNKKAVAYDPNEAMESLKQSQTAITYKSKGP